MEKLVRDRIPEIVSEQRGEPAPYRIASKAEYDGLLSRKLREEVEEYLQSRQPHELADILEVVFQLAREDGSSPEQLEALRKRKAEERGGFGGRRVMDF